mgnify:CR=1 FL=1
MSERDCGAFGRNSDRQRFEVSRGDNCTLQAFGVNKVLRNLRRVVVFLRGIENHARVVIRRIDLDIHQSVKFSQRTQGL